MYNYLVSLTNVSSKSILINSLLHFIWLARLLNLSFTFDHWSELPFRQISDASAASMTSMMTTTTLTTATDVATKQLPATRSKWSAATFVRKWNDWRAKWIRSEVTTPFDGSTSPSEKFAWFCNIVALLCTAADICDHCSAATCSLINLVPLVFF